MIGKTNALVGGGGPSPSGTIQISSNGIYDVGSYASANVNVTSPATEPTAAELAKGTISYFNDSTITEIDPKRTFFNCSQLTYCNIPNVTSLPLYAFENCINMSIINTGISTYAKVGGRAFFNCTSLISLSFLNQPLISTYVGIAASVYQSCHNLEVSLSISAGSCSIGAGAFQRCSKLSGLYIKCSSTISLYDYAFAGCISLSSIHLETSSNVILIRSTFMSAAIPYIDDSINIIHTNAIYSMRSLSMSSAFTHCNDLSYVKFDNIKIVDAAGAFRGCSSLTSVYISCSYNSIMYSYMFAECINLSSIYFENLYSIYTGALQRTALASISKSTIIYASSSAFAQCSNLIYVNMSNLSVVGFAAFSNCVSLKYINIMNVSYLSANTFLNCSALSSILFNTNMSIIQGSQVFQGCSVLESVYLFNTSLVTLSSTNTFMYTPMLDSTYLGRFGSIYVRQSLLTAYQTATNWTAYSSRIVGLTDAEIEQIVSAYKAVTYEDVVGE